MIEAMIGEHDDVAHYRVIVPAYAGTPISGMGAARRGGRFNRPGQEALYLSADDATALAEYKQDNPWIQPGTMHLLHQTTPRGGHQRRLRSRPVASRMGGFCDRLARRMVRQVDRAADLVHGGCVAPRPG